MTSRWLAWRRFTTDQMITGGLVAIGVTQLILPGFTGQGSRPNWLPERWSRPRTG